MKTTSLRNVLHLLDAEGHEIDSWICRTLIDEQVQKCLWRLEEDILKEIAASQGKHGEDQKNWIGSPSGAEARELIRKCIKDGR